MRISDCKEGTKVLILSKSICNTEEEAGHCYNVTTPKEETLNCFLKNNKRFNIGVIRGRVKCTEGKGVVILVRPIIDLDYHAFCFKPRDLRKIDD
jgi:hypothetical protein